MKNIPGFSIPLIIILTAAITAVFSGINQLLGIFSNVNIAGALISLVAAVVLIFYVPFIIRKNSGKGEIDPVSEKKITRISYLTAVFVLCAGTFPFLVQWYLVTGYYKKGQDATVTGASAEAQYYWTKAAHMYKQLGFTDKAIHSRLCLAQAYFQTGRTKEAEEILSYFEKSTDLTLTSQAKLYAVKGNMFEARGNLVQAEINYQKALQTASEDIETRATILMNKGVVVGNKGPLYTNEAIELLIQAKNLFIEAEEFSGVAQVYINLSAQNEFNPGIAIQYLDSAEVVSQKVNSDAISGIIAMNKGLFLKKEGKLDSAVIYYNRARIHFEKIGDVLSQAEVLTKLAYIDITRSSFASALQKVKDSMARVKSITSEDTHVNYIQLAKLYSVQADVMESCGDYKEAEKLIHLALDLLKEHRNYTTELNTKINYAAFLQRQGRNEEAFPVLKELESLVFTDFENKNSHATSVAINNIGKFYQDSGDLDKAMKLYNKALDISIAVGDKFFEAQIRENIAIIMRWNQNPQWEAEMNQALVIYRQIKNPTSELQCVFNFYKIGGDPNLLNQLLSLLENPSIEDYTKSNVILGLSIADFSDERLLNQHYLRLQSLKKQLEANNNVMLTGKCHLRLAETEKRFGRTDKIESHFDPIEKSLSLFPHPQNISMTMDFGLLKLGIGQYRSGVATLFDAFEIANQYEAQQALILKMVTLFWSELSNAEREQYKQRLQSQYDVSQKESFKVMVEGFLVGVGG